MLTGAAGIVGTALRPLLAARYDRVISTDLEVIDDLSANETFIAGDITDQAFVEEITNQVDGIVHLAGRVGAAYTFDDVLGPNIIGTNHLFEGARRNEVQRIVFASSHHAVGFIRRGEPIDEHTAPRPNSEYGLSKAYGEAAASYYADKFGLNILSIRIGYVGDDVCDDRRLRTWVSPRDLAQLVGIGLDTSDLGHEIVYGVSDNPDPFFDNSNAEKLGYRPMDRSSDHVSDPSVLTKRTDPNTIEGAVVGGGFAANGFDGDLDRVLGLEK